MECSIDDMIGGCNSVTYTLPCMDMAIGGERTDLRAAHL